nr:hypothetical protein [Burkholderia cepacia]
MLRVTVELWPGGSESSKRVIATADIGRIKDGKLADYKVYLQEGLLGDVGDVAYVRRYPRWSATVWDLVVRCLSAALNGGKEKLPERPVLPNVPVHTSGTERYVRLSEIPEPANTFFRRNIAFTTCPVIEEDSEPIDCAYASDWEDFLQGRR